MKTKFIPPLRRLVLAGTALLLLGALPNPTHAAFVFTLTETAGNVVINGSGTLNTTALTSTGSGTTVAVIAPRSAVLTAGPATSTNCDIYTGIATTGLAVFGTGGNNVPNQGSGNRVGLNGSQSFLFLPLGYVSGTALTNSETFTGRTFANLGFTPGTYVYTWGSGANADSLTITSVVPEPSTWALAVGGLTLLFLLRRRVQA